ncbi:MAG TPA: BrnT family toxin [Spirochaetota bacterium]|nr:BrnT family toxin [Spirochaetota bacterium]HOR45713.1 BrnT family toxin [Spirochaetota bacterium]HOU85768.1 BrnT family toxin [Spirochaetota bacterium]HPK57393.1 BrnT family toxin [Spirochaetota bacterium]
MMKFEWDENKNLSNLQKHEISFEEAKDIFSGIYKRVLSPVESGEQRYLCIGIIKIDTIDIVITVVAVFKKNIIRIISARPSSRQERRFYYENKR